MTRSFWLEHSCIETLLYCCLANRWFNEIIKCFKNETTYSFSLQVNWVPVNISLIKIYSSQPSLAIIIYLSSYDPSLKACRELPSENPTYSHNITGSLRGPNHILPTSKSMTSSNISFLWSYRYVKNNIIILFITILISYVLRRIPLTIITIFFVNFFISIISNTFSSISTSK